MKKKIRKRAGSVLVFSVVLLGMMLIIGLGIAEITASDRFSVLSTAKSAKALQIADSGAEIINKIILSDGKNTPQEILAHLASDSWTCPSGNLLKSPDSGVAGGKVEITLKDKNGQILDCNETAEEVYSLKSVGISSEGNAKRAIETPVCNISNCSDIAAISLGLAGDQKTRYALCADIDCADYGSFSPISDVAGNEFKSVFDGRGFTLSNMVINNATPLTGMFKQLQSAGGAGDPVAEIKNLKLANFTVNGKTYTGALVGSCLDARITNVTIDNTSIINGENTTGGIIGTASGCTLTNLSSSANVNALLSDATATPYAGALVGRIIGASRLASSFSKGNLTATCAATNTYVGGLAGYFGGTALPDVPILTDSYSKASISNSGTCSFPYAGGLIGYLGPYATINNSYAANPTLTATRKGGFIGDKDVSINTESYDQSYWQNTASTNCRYDSVSCATDSTAYPKTESDLRDQNPAGDFSGWSAAIWQFQSGRYPCLLALTGSC